MRTFTLNNDMNHKDKTLHIPHKDKKDGKFLTKHLIYIYEIQTFSNMVKLRDTIVHSHRE